VDLRRVDACHAAAALAKLIASGSIALDASTVVVLTGGGLKATQRIKELERRSDTSRDAGAPAAMMPPLLRSQIVSSAYHQAIPRTANKY
jgi:hypothetical protein